MAITRGGVAFAEATSVTPPAHIAGDILIGVAFRDGSTTNPTIPAGWTSITNTADGTSCSTSLAWKRALSSAEASGTWTNATSLMIVTYRGCLSTATPVGTIANAAGTTNTVTYSARTLSLAQLGVSSWMIAFASHRSVDTTLETAPTNMTNFGGGVGALTEQRVHDTNGPALIDWPGTNVSITGTASGWQTHVIELKAEMASYRLQNYMKIKAPTANAGVVSITG